MWTRWCKDHRAFDDSDCFAVKLEPPEFVIGSNLMPPPRQGSAGRHCNPPIKALKGAITAPTGPVVEEGEVNYKRYSLRANPALDMSIEEIAEYLEGLGVKVREIILETKGNTSIPCGGIQIYA